MLPKKIVLVVGFCVLFLLIAGCGGKNESANREKKTVSAPIGVQAVHVLPTTQYYETSGNVKANIVSRIAAKALGQVTALYVSSGQQVVAGQVLADIADDNINQKVAAAEAGVREAAKGMQVAQRNQSLQRITFERYEQLYEQAAISSQQVDEIRSSYEVAQLSYEQAQAGMEKAQAMLAEAYGYGQLISPINGVVTEKNLEVGSMVPAGVPVVTVEDGSSYLVECYVEAALHDKIYRDMEAVIRIASFDHPIQGRVVEIVPAIDPQSRSFLVKVSLNDKQLKTGLYGTVQFPLGREPRLMVPKASLVTKGQLTGVYVVNQEKQLSYRLVRIGMTNQGGIEILSGLNDGDYVVVEGVENAIDGATAQEVNGL